MASPITPWKRVDAGHYQAHYSSGRFEVRHIDGRWTLWFTANLTRGAIRKPGSWPNLAAAKRRADVLDADHFLQR